MANQIIQKRHNAYKRLDGVIASWSMGDDVQRVTLVDEDRELHEVNWRAPEDPTAGDQVSLIMVHDGVSAKRDRPLLILNQTTGHAHREQNAPEPRGTASIIFSLIGWIAIAMIVSGAIIANTTGLTMLIFLLVAAAIIVWRLAIATSEVRYNEKASQRKLDEEALCSDIISNEWRSNTASRKPRIELPELPELPQTLKA